MPFALIKLYEPDFSEFYNKEISINNEKVELNYYNQRIIKLMTKILSEKNLLLTLSFFIIYLFLLIIFITVQKNTG